ncbi:unnamed protein product [Cuscuta campestris]|uniref:Protein kinase domain-containing protein n=1 Tax=Cuscuta campestris TaxID=132261 RepID=A0A484K445_9ASTE|nr:unnamed protein product [Cuscuta campestris]
MKKHLSSSNSPFLCFFFLFFFTVILTSESLALSSDGLSLLALKSAISGDPTQLLANWSESDSSPCRWAGITCDRTHRVTSVSLSNANLSGYIPSELGALSSLSSLSLSHNSFCGPLPPQITALTHITHLDLSSNLLNGSLPPELNSLSNLAGTLNLSYNRFSGEIPASYGLFPVILSLDLRHNNLTGKIPPVGSLLNQGPTAFSENPFLCGFPLHNPCQEPEAQNPRGSPDPGNPRNPGVLPVGVRDRSKSRYGFAAVSLISGVLAVAGVVVVSLWAYRRRRNPTNGEIGKDTLGMPEISAAMEEGQNGKYVAVDEGFGLELEDLLRASAYVVGKSKSGIVYKVVAGGGGGRRSSSGGGTTVVAVRRLSEEGDPAWRFREFEAEVEAIGRVQHPNIVRLRAYYYANDEKLLVTDFISNGSLHNALHGGPGMTLPALPWAARLKISQGIARGLAHIHECSPKRYVHGNIKSSKILLDEDLMPYISGFGLTRLSSTPSRLTSSSSKKTGGCPKPEPRSSVPPKLTQKCDVYSFGVVLLEILTGRVPNAGLAGDGKGLDETVRRVFEEERPLSEIIDPSLLCEVHCKKQVVATFHIALNCTEMDPELRPRMRSVAETLDRIGLQ